MFFKILALCHTVIIADHNLKLTKEKAKAGTVAKLLQKFRLRKKDDASSEGEDEEDEDEGQKEAPKEEVVVDDDVEEEKGKGEDDEQEKEKGDDDEDKGSEEGDTDIEEGKEKGSDDDGPDAYQAASPDEAALVTAARKLGYAFSVSILCNIFGFILLTFF